MVDHSPWRDIGSAVHTLSHLPDASVLRSLPTEPDQDVLAFVLSSGEPDDISARLIREFPRWSATTAARAELVALLETVRAVRQAVAGAADVPAPHLALSEAIGADTPRLPADSDDRAVAELMQRLRHLAGPQIEAWADGASRPILKYLMTVDDPRPLARLTADRPAETARAALRVLLSRVWPDPSTDIGERSPLVPLPAAPVSANELTLTASGAARGARGFLVEVAYAFRAADGHRAAPGPRPGPRRSLQWPGPVLATDDAGFAYALVRRDHRPATDGPGDAGMVELTYVPAFSPRATVLRLRCDRYERHAFVVPSPGDPRPLREVTDQPIDLKLSVAVPRVE